MNTHYITSIKINKLKHLENISINLDENERKHLLITGKNGVGKTTLLSTIKDYLKSIEADQFINRKYNWYNQIKYYEEKLSNNTTTFSEKEEAKKYIEDFVDAIKRYGEGIELDFSQYEDLPRLYTEGNFILSYYPANRQTNVEVVNGIRKIELKKAYSLGENASNVFIAYLVDLKTQQSFAQNEGDKEVVENISAWFNRLENALKSILDDSSIGLKFDYKNYDFKIVQKGREEYGLNELSDGYSSVISVVADLILKMDKNRAGEERNYVFDTEGIVLIDEVETHLHIELQKKILPFLTEFFPSIQFIVTTHSPFVLSSIDTAVIYDLEKKIQAENLSNYSYEGIVEGYFEIDTYSSELKEKINRYKELVFKENLDNGERAELRIELKNASSNLAKELKAEFNEIENRRKNIR